MHTGMGTSRSSSRNSGIRRDISMADRWDRVYKEGQGRGRGRGREARAATGPVGSRTIDLLRVRRWARNGDGKREVDIPCRLHERPP